jgi:hypothetical protein
MDAMSEFLTIISLLGPERRVSSKIQEQVYACALGCSIALLSASGAAEWIEGNMLALLKIPMKSLSLKHPDIGPYFYACSVLKRVDAPAAGACELVLDMQVARAIERALAYVFAGQIEQAKVLFSSADKMDFLSRWAASTR